MNDLCLSLTDIVGESYIDAVCKASAALGLGDYASLRAIADERVDFYPKELEARLDGLVARCGQPFSEPLAESNPGAATAAFAAAFHKGSAPLSGLGPYRIGEDGKLALIGKSEHYQSSLGHNFPGYRLLVNAQRIGILNATHNNTRGHITRILERELVRLANGLKREDTAALDAVMNSTAPHVLNRVINLETGSLVCEAAYKMMLARFYRLQGHLPAPKYSGRTPVFLVMQDYKGGREANYHGTTIMTQMLRGMWPELAAGIEAAGLLKTVAVKINDIDDFRKAIAEYDTGKTKVAGFIHELVLMNYGAIALTEEYVHETDAICAERDIPVFVDEIQSCMWSSELFMFREYNSHPDFVSVGKGFPGGNYPASRMVTTAAMDNLNLFGALVTNGQEELASLSNLITIRFAEANAEHFKEISAHWQAGLKRLAQTFPKQIIRVEGRGMLTALVFQDVAHTEHFGHALGERFHIDAGVQTYKADCPPAVLTKLPLISTPALLDYVINAMETLLTELENA